MIHKVIYTDRIIPKRFAAYTIGPVILIRPRYLRDRGLLEHELVHVWQFWRTLCLHGIANLLSCKYRFKCEVEAYREQMRWSPANSAPVFAQFLVDKYGLKVTHEEALAALTKP